MPQNFGTTVTAQKFMANTLKVFFQRSFLRDVTNKDFYTPGDDNPKTTKSIKSKNQKFTISTLYSNGWKDYTGGAISASKVKESVSTLTINNFKSLEDEIESMAHFQSSVGDPQSSVIQDAGGKLKQLLDKAVLAMYGDAGAGNWVGTDYTTGTVAIDASGNVTGSGTTFTSAMVGRPFKADGHSKWYRVKSYASATSIVIENDSDDEASSYDGGVISSGASYTIQAVNAVAITKSNIAAQLQKISQNLDENEVPDDGQRFVILPAVAKSALLSAPEFNVDIEKVHGEIVKKGQIANAYGLRIFIAPTNWFSGDNTNGIYCVAGHKSFITAGYGFIEPITIVDSDKRETGYGDLIKGLFAFGFKVADERRKAGATFFATFS